jgi:hypothetical protein
MTDIDELRAYRDLMIGQRQRLVLTVLKEHRELTALEVEEVASLTTAISGVLFTLNELAPPPSQPAPPVPNPDYRLVASELYSKNKLAWQMTLTGASEWGRWLITTISAIHLGGLYLVSTATTIDDVHKSRAAWVLGIGLLLIILAGLAAWRNYSAFAELFNKWSDPNMLVDHTRQPQSEETINARIQRSYLWSIWTGVASALCIPLAILVLIGLPS